MDNGRQARHIRAGQVITDLSRLTKTGNSRERKKTRHLVLEQEMTEGSKPLTFNPKFDKVGVVQYFCLQSVRLENRSY